jgi:hypothetical protein
MRHWTLLLILLALPWGVFSQSNGLNLALANQLVKLPLKGGAFQIVSLHECYSF